MPCGFCKHLLNGGRCARTSGSIEKRYLDQIVIERCAGADVGQRLRDRLIHISPAWAQLIPPDRQRDSDAGVHAIRNARQKLARSSIVPYPDHLAVLDPARRGVCGVELNKRLTLSFYKRFQMREARVQEGVCRRA